VSTPVVTEPDVLLHEIGANQNPVFPQESFMPLRDQEPEDVNQSQPKGKINREAIVSWLFLIGSLMFVLDAILENARGVSFSSLLHLSASILFTIGSALFIPGNSEP
jgi:hypothetical protein